MRSSKRDCPAPASKCLTHPLQPRWPTLRRRCWKNTLNFVRHSALALLAISPLLGGCVTNSQQTGGVVTASQPDLADQIREVDLSPRFPQRIRGAGEDSKRGPRAREYLGDGIPPSGQPVSSRQGDPITTGSTNATSNKGYEINFENTPVPTVAKAVLGDILGIPYVIDPRVKGTVSLSSGRAVPRDDLLYVVDNALRVSNVALVREGDGYRLVPSADAVGAGAIDRNGSPDAGYGISVIPLQHVSASVLIRLIENFSAKPGMVRADEERNLLLIQ